jgi:crotonobetainyl-CoA:carnitine CoA-transferase CaiB-like acyl-CoA transferase
LGRPELIDDERFATTSLRVEHKQVLLPIVASVLAEHSIDHWMSLLRDAIVPSAPIYDFKQVYNDPQIKHRKLVKTVPHPLSGTMSVVGNPLNFSETPIEYNRAPPMLGQHTEEILRELLGLDEAAIHRLAEQKVIAP